MRKFYLSDGSGTTYGLNGENGFYLENPTGLGAELPYTTNNLGKGFFTKYEPEEYDVQSIVFDLHIMKNAYSQYATFIGWLLKAENLFFQYQPYGTAIYYRKVMVAYVTKTELTNGIKLTCPVSLTCLTPWYTAENRHIGLAPYANNGVRYEFTYDSDLQYSPSETSYSATIIPQGQLASAVTISYTGTLYNPIFKIEGEDSGTEYGRCEVVKNIASGTTVFSTKYDDCYIKNGTTDLIGYVNPSYDPFFKIPINENIVLTLSANNVLSATADVTIYSYYRSV